MSVDTLQRVCIGKREFATQHSVENYAQRIEIATKIQRPIHATRLLRRQVGKSPFAALGMNRVLFFLRKPGGDPEIDDLDVPASGLDQDVSGRQVLMDNSLFMDGIERCRDLNGDIEERGGVHTIFRNMLG